MQPPAWRAVHFADRTRESASLPPLLGHPGLDFNPLTHHYIVRFAGYAVGDVPA